MEKSKCGVQFSVEKSKCGVQCSVEKSKCGVKSSVEKSKCGVEPAVMIEDSAAVYHSNTVTGFLITVSHTVYNVQPIVRNTV